ncbi:MAG: hypothetical protein KAW92_11860 [Candidatus Cloacimonetes bacterium]|nr:hypothetical protein [Candidatus Cloacimonadota bacterium]
MLLTITDLYRGFGSKFFDDQWMYSQDLNNIEYTKLKTIRDSLASIIKQPGVAIDSLSESSLKVAYVDAKHFTVNPGTAIDKYGRIIYVPSNTAASGSVASDPYYHPAWPTRENIAHNQLPDELTTYYVNIYYTTQQDIAETDDKGDLHYTREYDSYYIIVEDSTPGDASSGLCLANFPVNASGDIVGGSGSINDCRLLLLCGMQEFTTPAREIFRKEFLADDSVNDYFTERSWKSGDFLGAPGVYVPKARASFKYYGETQVNVNFCVPAASDAGSVKVDIASNSSSCSFGAGAGNYSFSLNLDTDLSQDILYDITVYLANVNGGETAYVSELIIDVV